MLTFRLPYFIFTTLLFLVEVLIALFVHDRIIRPYIGDFLVVILIYSFFRTFLKIPYLKLAIGVLLFAYTVELLQYLQVVKHLGLQKSKVATVVIGTSFEWFDMVAYTLGIALVITIERIVEAKYARTLLKQSVSIIE